MADEFSIVDATSSKRVAASDGDEVTLYVRPGGMKSVVVRYATDIPASPSVSTTNWFVRWDTDTPIVAAFTEIPVAPADTSVDTGVIPNVVTYLQSVAAVIIDITIPGNWTGIARCSVIARNILAVKAVVIKLVVLPFDSILDVSFIPKNLIDIGWELQTDAIWSIGIAERWGLNGNTLASYGDLCAGGKLLFGIVPLIGGVPLTGVGAVTALSFQLRRAQHYDEDPLVNVSPAVTLVTVGSDKYYSLAADLTGDVVQAAFADWNALAAANSTLNIDTSRLPCILKFTLTTADGTYVSRGMSILLEQPVAFP